jgi:DNA-binding winged helix-turn-helix (wHTH) protein
MKVQFGPFTLDTDARQVQRGREAVHLSPKAFDLLAMLVAQRPAVVEKGALRERLWPGVHVVDTTLNNLIAEIRDALGDRRSSPSYLRTVHGIGYAFSADAVDLDSSSPASTSPAGRRPTPFWIVWNDRPIVLVTGENVIGRDPACAVWIDESGVSRRHASIHVPPDAVSGPATIEDLDSTNGTSVQGRRVTRAHPLANGDRIRLGEATLVFRASGPAERTRRVRPRRAGRV